MNHRRALVSMVINPKQDKLSKMSFPLERTIDSFSVQAVTFNVYQQDFETCAKAIFSSNTAVLHTIKRSCPLSYFFKLVIGYLEGTKLENYLYKQCKLYLPDH